MTPIEAAKLLAIVAVYDNRTASRIEAQQWAADLDGISLDEAAAAVREHYTANPDTWLKAGHVIGIVKRRRRNESRGLWLAELRALRHVDPDDPHAVLDALRRVHAAASRRPEPGPDRLALPPGKFTDNPAQATRNAEGVKAAQRALPGRSRIPAPRRDAMAELRQITTGPGWTEPDDDGGEAA